ncbi:MAG: hypothetical protein P4M11_04315, partial [Candidatus Pacebacteria bacterium]|nr:hypothetical protein [Candidatus Paceibacterota bacterium]
MFESRKQTTITLIMFASSVAAMLVSAYKNIPESGLTLTLEHARKVFVTAIVVFTCNVLCEIYFDKVRNAVYAEVKKYSDEVKRATEDKENFFAVMSHEIRNPLQSLLGSV